MTGPYATAIIVVALLLAAAALLFSALNRPVNLVLLAGVAALELMLLVFLVGGVVQMVQSSRHFARAEFVGYLLGIIVIPPVAVVWQWGEKSRSAAAVIALGCLVTPVMVLRIQQVWAGPHG